MNVLVVDVGGSAIKIAHSAGGDVMRFDSASDLRPRDLVRRIEGATPEPYEAVSIGYPGKVNAAGPSAEPGNLGTGWVGFDFERALGRPVRVVNDAVMQAIGAYDGGRMLFLGFGTGVGSAIVTEHVVVPLELGVLPFGARTLADALGNQGLERDGVDQWRRHVLELTPALRRACLADYVVLGGGNAKHVDPLPSQARRGDNEDAITGGVRLWNDVVEPHDRRPSPCWRVVS
jgi:polyphosphate glucokinase